MSFLKNTTSTRYDVHSLQYVGRWTLYSLLNCCPCLFTIARAVTQRRTHLPCFLWQLCSLETEPCPCIHTYDIIWHWSSCLLTPPPLLPLPSFAPPSPCLQVGGLTESAKSCCVFLPSAVCWPLCLFFSPKCFLYSFIITSAFLFTLHWFFSLSSISPCLSLSPSPSHTHSIVNFNLRAGLNGTIRERSMLLIWMPVNLDLSVRHERRKKITLHHQANTSANALK